MALSRYVTLDVALLGDGSSGSLTMDVSDLLPEAQPVSVVSWVYTGSDTLVNGSTPSTSNLTITTLLNTHSLSFAFGAYPRSGHVYTFTVYVTI